MEQKTQEQLQTQMNHDKYNSITQKTTPENQNETHNVRKEGMKPVKQ